MTVTGLSGLSGTDLRSIDTQVGYLFAMVSEGLAAATAACLIQQMGAIAVEMWRTAATAFREGDPTAAARLRRRDDDLDDLHVTLTSELAAVPLPVPVAIEMGLVARFFERLGDHAVNVSRRLALLAPAP